MIGEFHYLNRCPGLRNLKFYPLRTPLPALVIRNQVPSDIAFMVPEKYSLEKRKALLYYYENNFIGTEKENQAKYQLERVTVEKGDSLHLSRFT